MSQAQAVAATPASSVLTTRRFVIGIIVSCLFLQRFGLAFGEQALNCVGPIGLALGVFGLLQGTLSFDRRRLVIFLFMVCWILLGMAFHAAWPAAYGVPTRSNSIIQFLLLTSFLTLSFSEPMEERSFFQQVNLLFGIIAVAGILQFIAQFAGLSVFSFDGLVPPKVLVEFGWNQQIASGVGESLKSNGFFLQEPSIFSQFMAMALLIEVLVFKRVQYLCLFVAGLFLSFSGTGWIVLAAFVAGLGASLGIRGIVLGVVSLLGLGAVMAIVIAFSPGTGTALSARTNEIFTPLTSGHLRFVTPFWLLSDVLDYLPSALTIGIGAGTSEHLPMIYEYDVNTPVKITLEYGLPVFLAYFLLYVVNDHTPMQRAIVLPAVIMVLFTGSYAQFPPVLFLIALIICVARLRQSPLQRVR